MGRRVVLGCALAALFAAGCSPEDPNLTTTAVRSGNDVVLVSDGCGYIIESMALRQDGDELWRIEARSTLPPAPVRVRVGDDVDGYRTTQVFEATFTGPTVVDVEWRGDLRERTLLDIDSVDALPSGSRSTEVRPRPPECLSGSIGLDLSGVFGGLTLRSAIVATMLSLTAALAITIGVLRLVLAARDRRRDGD